MSEKAFSNFKHNGIHLNFPNGNSVSTIWGRGSYSDNYNYGDDLGLDFIKTYEIFLDSDNVEIMVDCSDTLLKRLKKKFDGDNPFGRIDLLDWLYVVNAVAKDDRIKPSTNLKG